MLQNRYETFTPVLLPVVGCGHVKLEAPCVQHMLGVYCSQAPFAFDEPFISKWWVYGTLSMCASYTGGNEDL